MNVEEKIHQKLSEHYAESEVAALLQKNQRTLARWYDERKGPPATLISGRRGRYYNKKKFLKWLTDREQMPAQIVSRWAGRSDERVPRAAASRGKRKTLARN